MSKLLMLDRETNVNFNDKEENAVLSTSNTQLIRKVKKMLEDFPDKVTLIDEKEQFISVSMPKLWLKISTPRKLSDEQRFAAAERMKQNRKFRKKRK